MVGMVRERWDMMGHWLQETTEICQFAIVFYRVLVDTCLVQGRDFSRPVR